MQEFKAKNIFIFTILQFMKNPNIMLGCVELEK